MQFEVFTLLPEIFPPYLESSILNRARQKGLIDVRVHNIQDRRSTKQAKKPWIVRITIEGREKGKAFRTRAEADRYRMLLLRAVEDGERFDPALGEPKSWQPSLRDELVHRWARDLSLIHI